MKPKCLECVNFTRWEQASGGTIPRCSRFEAVEEMIRTETRLWNLSGKWASTWEADVYPSYPAEEIEPAYVCEEPERDAEAAVQEWLNSRLVRLDTARPVYRSIYSIEEDILWKFTSCREYVEIPEGEAWDDPLLLSHCSFSEGQVLEPIEAPLSPTLIEEIQQIPVTAELGIAVLTGCP